VYLFAQSAFEITRVSAVIEASRGPKCLRFKGNSTSFLIRSLRKSGNAHKFSGPSPSMRRPIWVKQVLWFPLSGLLWNFSASAAILPSALFGERYSLGASWVFSFQWCCYLRIDLCSHRFGESWAPGLSRSHLDSAVELGSSDRNSLGHFPHRFLAIARWFVHLSPYGRQR